MHDFYNLVPYSNKLVTMKKKEKATDHQKKIQIQIQYFSKATTHQRKHKYNLSLMLLICPFLKNKWFAVE